MTNTKCLHTGRLIRNRSGNPVHRAFHNYDQSGLFVGGMSDPLPLKWDREERLVLAAHSRTFGPISIRSALTEFLYTL